jgi:hypothetical protein
MSAGPILYSIAPVKAPPPGITITSAFGLNNSGQITGTAATGTTAQAFIGSTSSFALIPLAPGSNFAEGFAINNLGQVTGAAIAQSSDPAFIGSTSGSSLIPLPSGDFFGTGEGINDSGVVVASGASVALNNVFTGTAAGSSLVPPPPGWFSANGAFGINNSGEVIAFGTNPTTAQLFVSSGGTSTPVPLPTGFDNSFQGAINNSGQVAGIGALISGSFVNQAYIGTTTGTMAIPLPTGATSVTLNGEAIFIGLNDLGVVIGNSDVGPWIWDPMNGTRLLNGLLPQGWTLSQVLGINDLGQISALASFSGTSADGINNEVVILSQTTPEPGTFGLIGMALAVGIGARMRRSRCH